MVQLNDNKRRFKGSKYLDLSTDASKRFERDIDIDSTISSLNQLTSLIQSVAGGQIIDGVIDFYPNHKKIKQWRLEKSITKKKDR